MEPVILLILKEHVDIVITLITIQSTCRHTYNLHISVILAYNDLKPDLCGDISTSGCFGEIYRYPI